MEYLCSKKFIQKEETWKGSCRKPQTQEPKKVNNSTQNSGCQLTKNKHAGSPADSELDRVLAGVLCRESLVLMPGRTWIGKSPRLMLQIALSLDRKGRFLYVFSGAGKKKHFQYAADPDMRKRETPAFAILVLWPGRTIYDQHYFRSTDRFA